jgi:hypothetical protein
MNFSRLRGGHVLALVAALGLLLAMSVDWYTTKAGEDQREFQEQVAPELDRRSGEPSLSEQARGAAEKQEKNAWQASALVDRLILIALVAAAGLAMVAAFTTAAGRRLGPPSPSALAAVIGLLASALIAYRILQPPGLNEGAVVKIGAPLSLLCVGLVALGSRSADRAGPKSISEGSTGESGEGEPVPAGQPGGPPPAAPAG